VAIPPEEIAQVRAATDIVALIGEQVALKKAGRRWQGLCPFHNEKTPSFSVNGEEGLYYCFGCQKSGDAISFVRETQGLEFIDAIRLLADRAGIVLHEDEAGAEGRRDRSQLLDALEQAVEFYHQLLLNSPEAGAARHYLRQRGYDGEVVRQFRLGWAPDDWDRLATAIKVPSEILERAGLGFVNRRGRQQDFLRARIVFPIMDPSGRPIAMGGRILPPQPGAPPPERPEPKYKNSPEGPIYSKRRTLYGLNWAKKQIVETGEIIVCEGYTDVIAFFRAGLPRAVATCGTALGEEHFQVMRNFAKRIVLAYDGDAAGQSATSRVYEWERTHEVDVAVMSLPDGMDPAELAAKDPEALRVAIAEAKPFLAFRVERAMASFDHSTPEGRARAAEAALAMVAEHPSALVRDQYVLTIADRCRLEPQLVRDSLARHVAGGARSASERSERRRRDDEPPPMPPPEDEWAQQMMPSAPSQPTGGGPGLEALRLAVHRPDLVAGRFEPFLFVDPDQRRAFEALLTATSLNEAIESAPGPAGALLRRVAVEEPVFADEGSDPVAPVVAQLIRAAVRGALARLQAELRAGQIDLAEGSAQVASVHEQLTHLDDARAGQSASEALLDWLAMREDAA
jgi:DNA primase